MNTNNKLLKAGGIFIAPWIYFFLLRPKLRLMEQRFDDKITNISDEEMLKIKKKYREKIEKDKKLKEDE